jgi:hypothetical protein
VLSKFKPKVPDPQVEKLFHTAYKKILEEYNRSLAQLKSGKADFINKNLDTGDPSRPGEYEIADKTYDELLVQLGKNKFEFSDDALKKNLAEYFSGNEFAGKHESAKDRKRKETLSQMNFAQVK